MEKEKAAKLIAGGLMAGMCIGIAATVFLKVGGVMGAAMFAFGLIVVVVMQLPLYTGQAQHVWGRKGRDYAVLGLMLLLNLVGCGILSLLTAGADITAASEGIISTRLTTGPLMNGVLAIPCGFIMTAAVRGATLKKTWLPLLFGVPAFIICGFPHCVADSFYYASCSNAFLSTHGLDMLWAYLPTVAGNYVGCNLYRLVPCMPSWFEANSAVTAPEPEPQPDLED